MNDCRACHAPIRWVGTEASGNMMPLDAQPDPTGNVVLVDDPRRAGRDIARVLGPLECELLGPDDERWMPHHATCPNWPMPAP